MMINFESTKRTTKKNENELMVYGFVNLKNGQRIEKKKEKKKKMEIIIINDNTNVRRNIALMKKIMTEEDSNKATRN